MVIIEEVLTKLGWDDGFHVPVANEQNKNLEEEIERKIKYRSALNLELETITQRIESIEKHVVNIGHEHEQNQKLLTAQSMQLDSEDHVFRLCNSTSSKLSQEVRQFDKERTDIEQRIETKEIELRKLIEKINSLKKAAKFDKDQLLKWEEALQRGEEDNQLIEKYMRSDGKKFKELELKRQKLQVQVEHGRQTILMAVNGVAEMENVLDRTAKLYGSVLAERQQLINQWMQSVLVLKQRDTEINNALREIDKLRELGREKMVVLQEAEKFLENQVNNNKQLEECVRLLEKKLVVIKDERLRILHTCSAYTTELHVQKKLLINVGQRIQSIRIKRKDLKMELENKEQKVNDSRKELGELKETYENIDNRRTDIAERTKQLENMIKKEEKLQELIIKEVNRLQVLNMRSTSRLMVLDGEIKTVELQIQNEQKKIELLDAFNQKEQKQLEEKIEATYHHDFQIQKAQMKLRHLTGVEQDSAVMVEKERVIADLEKSLNEKTDLLKLLQSQISALEHHMKELSSSITSTEVQLQFLKNKKQDQMLLMEGGQKQLKVVRLRNEQTQVNENILRLRICQAEKTISNIDNKVYNLEKHKLQVQAAMHERQAEIKAQKEMLKLERRVTAAKLAELRLAISERRSRILQLHARYDNLMSCLGTTTAGVPLTTTYIKIKSAQEKYTLQEQGDKLDGTIRKTECEIQSMENTLRIVNASNDKYKRSLGLIEDNGPEQMEQRKLNEEMYNELERVRHCRVQLEQAKSDLKIMEDNYHRLSENIEIAGNEQARKKQCIQILEHQISDQQEKQMRADKGLHKVYKNIQNMSMCTEDNLILIQEKDIAVRELQEQNGLALQHITEFMVRHVEVDPYIKKLLSDKSMVLPCTNHLKPSPTGSRCQSSASSTSTNTAVRKSGHVLSSIPSSTPERFGSILNIEANFDESSARGKTMQRIDCDARRKKSTARCATFSSSSSLSSGEKWK